MMMNLVSLVELAGFPPRVPLMTETIHTFGWLLVVALVAVPGLVLASSVLREALVGASSSKGDSRRRRSPTRLCPGAA
jgi:hypothetical protein